MIPWAYIVKTLVFVGDDAGKNVESSGRTLGIRFGVKICRQCEFFEQRDQIGVSTLQNRRGLQRECVQSEALELLGHGFVPRQEAATNAVGHWSEAQIQAGWLELTLLQRLARRGNPAFANGTMEPLYRQHARPQTLGCPGQVRYRSYVCTRLQCSRPPSTLEMG